MTLMFVFFFLKSVIGAALTCNVPPTIRSHLLPRTLRGLDQLEPQLEELMPSPVPSWSIGGWWSLVHGDLCCLCSAIVVQHRTNYVSLWKQRQNNFSAMLAWTTLGQSQKTSCIISHLRLEKTASIKGGTCLPQIYNCAI